MSATVIMFIISAILLSTSFYYFNRAKKAEMQGLAKDKKLDISDKCWDVGIVLLVIAVLLAIF